MLKAFSRTIGFIAQHPLSKGRRTRNLARYFLWQIGSRLVPGPVVVDFVNSAKLLVRPGMTGATGNLYVGLQEFEDMAFVAHFLRGPDLFIDVGANVGSYTVLAAAGAGASCIAFEPDPSAFEWLTQNVRLNGIGDRVETRRSALGSAPGQVRLTVADDTTNHVILDGAPVNQRRTQNVPITTLDIALGDRCPIMIKIDVEGFESEVISGGQSILDRTELRCVLMELNGSGERYGFDERLLQEHMARQGFEQYLYAPLERRLMQRGPHTPRSNNILFVRDPGFVEARLADADPIIVSDKEF